MREILVIIDMQDEFKSSRRKQTIQSIISLIRKFKSEQKEIIVVEYVGPSSTRWDILRSIGAYRYRTFLNKWKDDGSSEIQKLLQSSMVTPNITFSLCGVNFGACVSDTATGLAKKFPKATVNVIEEACNDNDGKQTDEYWESEKTYMQKNKVNVY